VLGPSTWRDEELPPLEVLQAVTKHRPIDFLKDVVSDLDDEVGTDPDDVTVESRVVELAHGHAVGDQRVTPRMGVGQDVGGVEQLDVVQSAHGARLLIGKEHPLAEGELMEPVPGLVTDCADGGPSAGD
jgi:hypothetical protein